MDRYDIDDILEEARRLKEQRRDVPAPSRPAEPAPAAPAAPAVVAERPAPESLPPVVTGPWEEPEEEPRKKRVLSFFSRKKEKEQEWEDEWEALAAPEQPVERTEELPPVPIPLVPAGREKPAPVPPAPAEPIKPSPAAPSAPEKADSATRVIELPQKEPPAKTKKPAKDAAAPPIEDMEGQMKLDDYVEPAVSAPTEAPAPAAESPAEPAAVLPEGPAPASAAESDGPTLEEQLEQTRREKIEEFQKKRQTHGLDFKLAGDEEEDNDPAEEPVTYEEEELEDYGRYEETPAVQNELNYRRRTGWIGVFLTLSLEAVLVTLSLLVHITGAPPLDPYLYIGLHGFMLLFMMLVNHQMVGGGLASLARMQADGDSAAAVAAVAALVHTLLQFIRPAAVADGTLELLAPVAGLSLLLAALGRQARVCRICANFRFVSYPGEKFAAHRIEDRQTAEEVGRAAVALGEPQVAFFKGAPFLTRFLENSYAEDGGDRVMKLFVPLLAAASALLGVGYGLLHPDGWWMALTVFVSALCLATPAAMTAMNFPLLRAGKKALSRGGMVSGWNAVKEFGHLHAVVVDAADLFPSESVLLHGIKTFSGTRIDEAILDAAAISIQAGGPLAAVFRRVIEDKTDILPAVDSLVYEQDMGLAGWVGGRRVLVGNRRLLENHGVDVPSRDYEMRYTKNNRQLVYLSAAGELSAMFVVSYVADEGIAEALHSLEKAGITLLVRTCDPNVTESLICDVLDIDGYYVEMLGTVAGRAFSRVEAVSYGEVPAVLASNGRIEGTAAALSACRRLRIGAGLGLAAQIVAACIGFALSLILAFRSGMVMPPVYALGYLSGAAILSWILPGVKRI